MKRNEATINQFLKIQIVTLSDRFQSGGASKSRYSIHNLLPDYNDVLTQEEDSDKTPEGSDLMKNKFCTICTI